MGEVMTMKIAKEIAEFFEPKMEAAIDSLDRVLRPARTRENLEAIIAEKLEPVKKALAEWIAIRDIDSKFRPQCEQYIGRKANDMERDEIASFIAGAEQQTEAALKLFEVI